MPIVEESMVTAAELQQYKCPGCNEWFKDFILFRCEKCTRDGWYKIILNPDWFPKQLEDGSPDWNSVKKDKAVLDNHWSYGRLNIKTMEMERVPIDRDGKKWNYLDYQISTAIEDKKIEILALKGVNGETKTAKEIKQEIKLEKEIEKRDIEADEKEKGPTETEREKKKEQKEVMKLIDNK